MLIAIAVWALTRTAFLFCFISISDPAGLQAKQDQDYHEYYKHITSSLEK